MPHTFGIGDRVRLSPAGEDPYIATIINFKKVVPDPVGGGLVLLSCTVDDPDLTAVAIHGPTDLVHPWDTTWAAPPQNADIARYWAQEAAFQVAEQETPIFQREWPDIFLDLPAPSAHQRLRIRQWLVDTRAAAQAWQPPRPVHPAVRFWQRTFGRLVPQPRD